MKYTTCITAVSSIRCFHYKNCGTKDGCFSSSSSSLVAVCFLACFSFAVRKIDTAARKLNWAQRWQGWGARGRRQKTSVQLSRGYIFYLLPTTNETHAKKQPFIIIIEKSSKKISQLDYRSWTSEWLLLENEVERYMHVSRNFPWVYHFNLK